MDTKECHLYTKGGLKEKIKNSCPRAIMKQLINKSKNIKYHPAPNS